MTGSVWISWSTGQPAFTNSTAQALVASNPYADDYPQPPLYQFAPQPEPQTQNPAFVASQARDAANSYVMCLLVEIHLMPSLMGTSAAGGHWSVRKPLHRQRPGRYADHHWGS